MENLNDCDEPPAADAFKLETRIKEYRAIHTGHPKILVKEGQEVEDDTILYKIERVRAEKEIKAGVKGIVKKVNHYYLEENIKTPRFVEFNVPLVTVEYKVRVNLREEWEEKNYSFIRAPFKCDYFRAPYPKAMPYVKEGSKVNIGDIVCIACIMKQKEEILSNIEGKVAKIYFENSQTIDKGEKLIGLRKDE